MLFLEIFKAWNFGGLIFGPEVFLGFVGSPRHFLGFDFFPPFYHPCHLKSRVPRWGRGCSLWDPATPLLTPDTPFPYPQVKIPTLLDLTVLVKIACGCQRILSITVPFTPNSKQSA